jgi:secreted Zn-dependent insulinase-like peptidase
MRITQIRLGGLVLALLCLAACATVAVQDTLQPVQSPADDYAYRHLTLDNGLQVLLISDPGAAKAAAALDVRVGSADNPPGREGLAHFLEHMLFLGTDKYPDPAEYEQFITEHGGSRNAYTSFEHTNYFFDVQSAWLEGALDRFAQFFIAPRFDAEYVEREIRAVEAEYQMGLTSDSRRGLDVLQTVMNPEHPFSQFTVGSLGTLADRPESTIRDEMLAFYRKYYSANQMRLVVLGTESLDELEAMVAPRFNQVPNRELQLDTIEAPLFAPELLPAVVKIEPVGTQRQLQVGFPVPDYRDRYRANPLGYLGNLVGHEGEGSLLSRLKAEGLAESLGAGAGLAWRGGGLFSVNITLTEQGQQDPDRVLQLLFGYLDLLREKGPQEWLYQEQSRLAELQFRYREKGNAINYVSGLASGMHYYAPRDVLRGPYLMDDYDPELLRDLLTHLRADQALVTLTWPGVETDRVTDFYQVPWALESVQGARLAQWRAPVAEGLVSLPDPNPFIPEDLSLVELPADVPTEPALALDSPRQRVWFAQDAEFRLPRGALYVNFRSPVVGGSVEQDALALLYVDLLKDAVNEFTYPALLAGLRFDLYKHAQGLSLRISGYDDRQLLLLEQLLATLQQPDFEAVRFESLRADRIRRLQNRIAQRPSSQVMDELREALLHGEWDDQAKIRALESATLPAVQAFADTFWAQASAESLVYGNYAPEMVEALAMQLSPLLPEPPEAALAPLRVTRLDAGQRLQYAVDIPHDDAVVAWYLQGRDRDWEERAMTALTGQIIRSGFFQQLRTEQQLGYVVSAFPWAQLEVPGLVLLVQSPNTPAPDVAAAMDAFMDAVPATVDDAQFARHQRALVGEITRPDKNLWERAEFFWQSIARQEYDFDSRTRLAEAVDAIELAQWSSHYRDVFRAQPASLQVVAPGRWSELPAGADRTYESSAALKDSRAYYQID